MEAVDDRAAGVTGRLVGPACSPEGKGGVSGTVWGWAASAFARTRVEDTKNVRVNDSRGRIIE